MHLRKQAYLGASALFLLAVLIMALASTTFLSTKAEALLIPVQEHWMYHVHWVWKEDLRKTVGIIYPQIIIANETVDKVQGYVADENGTRLPMYSDEQRVMVKYVYDNGAISKWQVAGKPHDGFFTIEIPDVYRDAQTIGIYIGGNAYKVDIPNSYEQPLVTINPVRFDYRTNSTLDQQPQITQATTIASTCHYSDNSLIDRILRQFSILPC